MPRKHLQLCVQASVGKVKEVPGPMKGRLGPGEPNLKAEGQFLFYKINTDIRSCVQDVIYTQG